MNCCCGGNDADEKKCKYESVPGNDRDTHPAMMQPPGVGGDVYHLDAQNHHEMSEICTGYEDLKDSKMPSNEKMQTLMDLRSALFFQKFDINALECVPKEEVEEFDDIWMEDAKLKKLMAYMNFSSYETEILGQQYDKITPDAHKMCCSCCEPACMLGCGWTWGRQNIGEDYLTDTGPGPLTKSDDFEQVFIEPKCSIKLLKRGTESFIMIISYPAYRNRSAPVVTIVPLDLIPPGLLGCDYDGNAINFYTWPEECKREIGECFCCCFVCDKKTNVTARGRPFASVQNISDPCTVVNKIQELRGLIDEDEMRKLLTKEFSIKQLGNHQEDKGVLNIYSEGYDTENFTVHVDFNNDEEAGISAFKEANIGQQIALTHGFQTQVPSMPGHDLRDWGSDDLHVYRHQTGNVTRNGLPSVPFAVTMNAEATEV